MIFQGVFFRVCERAFVCLSRMDRLLRSFTIFVAFPLQLCVGPQIFLLFLCLCFRVSAAGLLQSSRLNFSDELPSDVILISPAAQPDH